MPGPRYIRMTDRDADLLEALVRGLRNMRGSGGVSVRFAAGEIVVQSEPTGGRSGRPVDIFVKLTSEPTGGDGWQCAEQVYDVGAGDWAARTNGRTHDDLGLILDPFGVGAADAVVAIAQVVTEDSVRWAVAPVLPTPPEMGDYVLMSLDGVVQWVELETFVCPT